MSTPCSTQHRQRVRSPTLAKNECLALCEHLTYHNDTLEDEQRVFVISRPAWPLLTTDREAVARIWLDAVLERIERHVVSLNSRRLGLESGHA